MSRKQVKVVVKCDYGILHTSQPHILSDLRVYALIFDNVSALEEYKSSKVC